MKFQVPQFIDVEDKIFGPLSFKQAVYLGGGAGLSYVLYALLPLFIAIFLIIPVIALSVALAFYQVNKKPFIFVLEAAFKYFTGNKMYIWKKQPKKVNDLEEIKKLNEMLNRKTDEIPSMSTSKLKDMSWSIGVNSDTNENNPNK